MGGEIISEEVMITFYLFIGYEPQIYQYRLGEREGMEESERVIRYSVTVGVDFC